MPKRLYPLVLGLLLVSAGCAKNLLTEVRNYGLTPISPVTNLTPAVLIDPGEIWTGNPSIYAEPKDGKITQGDLTAVWSSGLTPQITRSHDTKFELSGTADVPDAVKVEATAKFATKYSVSASGNSIEQVRSGPFEKDLSPKYFDVFPSLPGLVKDGKVAYIQKVWISRSIEYRFYNESGATIDLDLSKLSIPAGVKGSWSRSSDGTYAFQAAEGAPGIVLGIKVEKLPIPGVTLSPPSVRDLFTAPKKSLK